jgi:hypothetical protein
MWTIILSALATYRLTILATRDRITEPIRSRLSFGRTGKAIRPRVEYFVTCPWCVSMWIAAAVVAMATWHWWIYPASALAFSAVAGFLAERS